MQKALVTITLLGLLLAASLACANNPARVRMDDKGITVYGVSISWEYIDLNGYEHIPAPTRLPVPTVHPALTRMPETTATPKIPTGPAATLSSEDWADDAILSQHYGQMVAIRGVFNTFRHWRGLIWLDNGMNLFCNFPDDYAQENEGFLWEIHNSDEPVLATGRMLDPTEPVIGVKPADRVRTEGLNDCTLKRYEEATTLGDAPAPAAEP